MKTDVQRPIGGIAEPKPAPPIPEKTTARDAIIGAVCAVVALLALTFAFLHFKNMEEPRRAMITGVVIEKVFTPAPAPEQQITYGSKGLKAEQIAGEYILKVRVVPGNRTYDVPVDQRWYHQTSLGEPLTFMLPASERQ